MFSKAADTAAATAIPDIDIMRVIHGSVATFAAITI
jgi:hypothetical protein